MKRWSSCAGLGYGCPDGLRRRPHPEERDALSEIFAKVFQQPGADTLEELEQRVKDTGAAMDLASMDDLPKLHARIDEEAKLALATPRRVRVTFE